MRPATGHSDAKPNVGFSERSQWPLLAHLDRLSASLAAPANERVPTSVVWVQMEIQPNPIAKDDAGAWAKARLRQDLAPAIRAHQKLRVRVIRDLIAALDNAEAVPIGDRHERYVVHAFGDRAVEVARLTLSSTDVAAIFANEIAARTEAAAEMASLNRSAEAEGLAAQAAIIKDYTSPI